MITPCPHIQDYFGSRGPLVSAFDPPAVKRRAFFVYLDLRSRLGGFSLPLWLDDYLRWHVHALGGLGGVW